MRHRKKLQKLGIPKYHREALLKNLLNDLFLHGSLQIVKRRAKALQSLTDRVITTVRKGESKMHIIRRLQQFGLREEVSRKLLDTYIPKIGARSSGFTTIAPVKFRKGDNALVMQISLL